MRSIEPGISRFRGRPFGPSRNNGVNHMHHIALDNETDFNGWRRAARTLALANVTPPDVTWSVKGDAELFAPSAEPLPAQSPDETFSVSAKFVDLAKFAILHRDRERFALLYRLQ